MTISLQISIRLSRPEIRAIIDANRDSFMAGFESWLNTNWHIYERFEKEAKKIVALGRNHYSARTICEFIRHETSLAELDDKFKINNNNIPDMARFFGLRNPTMSNLFHIRHSINRELDIERE